MSPRRPNPKPKPRDHADGSRTWFVTFRLNGVQTSRVWDTKTEALTFCSEARRWGYPEAVRLNDERTTTHTHSGAPTLRQVFEDYLAWKATDVRSSRTVEEYRTHWRAIDPTLGGIPIDEVTDTDVQAWVDGQAAGTIAPRVIKVDGVPTARPVSAKTIANRHGVLHGVLDYAAGPRRRLITANPCAHTDLPKRRKGLPKGLRPGEWDVLYSAMRAINPAGADLALALYASGARFGEMTALATHDVVDEGGDTVTLLIGFVIRREAGSRFVRVEDTKSEAGFRAVELDPDASAMIRRRVAEAKPGALLEDPALRLVFTNRDGKVWRPSAFRDRAWLPAVKAAGLSSRHPAPHWLRHTHVAELAAIGVHPAKIQSRIGHEHISTTLDVYGRTIEALQPDDLRQLAARRTRGRKPIQPGAGDVVPGEVLEQE